METEFERNENISYENWKNRMNTYEEKIRETLKLKRLSSPTRPGGMSPRSQNLSSGPWDMGRGRRGSEDIRKRRETQRNTEDLFLVKRKGDSCAETPQSLVLP